MDELTFPIENMDDIAAGDNKLSADTIKSETSTRFCVYLGPAILNHIQYGAVIRGTRAEVLENLSDAIAVYPQIRQLIIPDAELPEAKIKIRTPGNLLFAKRQELSDAVKSTKQRNAQK